MSLVLELQQCRGADGRPLGAHRGARHGGLETSRTKTATAWPGSWFGRLLAVVVVTVLTSAACLAEGAEQGTERRGIRLTLEKVSGIDHGTAVILQGETDARGDRFFIENLNITQPVSIILMAANPKWQPLTLNLSKYRYDQSDRRGETGASGALAFHFRTQGEVKIEVTPRSADDTERVRYFLIAWAGDDVVPDLPLPVVAPEDTNDAWGLARWVLLLFIVAGGVAVLRIALGRRSRRRNRSRMYVFLACGVAVGAPFVSLVFDARADPVPFNPAHHGTGNLAALRAAPEAIEWEGQHAADKRAVQEAGRRAVDAGIDQLHTGMGIYEDYVGLANADAALSDVLNPDDNEFDPDYTPEGSPTLPAHCATKEGPECECYADAYKSLNFVRFYLERLRAIYGATRNFTDNAIAFGDSMAGLHGGFGVAWPPERRRIQQTFEQMGQTYDGKYKNYMQGLRKALDAIAECESTYYGVEDWYGRFGFIYFTFMQDRYKRGG